jgi:ATP-binding cassette subfamily F protein 3
VRDGRLTHYLGDWEYYMWKKAQETGPSAKGSAGASPEGPASSSTRSRPATETATPSAHSPSPVAPAAATLGAGTAADRAQTVELGYKERKELQSRYRKIEKRILAAEARQAELASTLSDPEHVSDYELLASASAEATAVADEIVALYEEWGPIAESLGTTVG